MPWINEFHYDNAGADVGEFVEIAGAAGEDLSGWTLALYNGNPSQRSVYATLALSGVIGDQSNGYGFVGVAGPASGIQNGNTANNEPDGIALVRPDGTVAEFISYEGSFVAASGPAAGMTSVDVGAVEPGNANGTSIGRVGTGSQASDFTWALIGDDTPGGLNIGQSFAAAAIPTLSVGDVTVNEADGTATFTVTLSAAASGAVTVNYATADGTALAGSDYVAAAGTLTFAAGVTSQTVTVALVDDTDVEGDEAFILTLSGPVGATLGDATGEATIVSDDVAQAPTVTPFINEFHYDNAGADVGEFVEIAGAAGTDLTGWTLALYNGSPSQRSVYATLNLSGVIGDQSNGYGFVSVAGPASGIQNGNTTNNEPDGIALVRPDGTVAEFISYEGSFVAASGPAAGMTSVDVGAVEPGNANGTSIGRVGTGSQASDFTWALIGDDSPGGLNAGQSFVAASPRVSVDDVSIVEGNDGTSIATFTVTRTGPLDAFTVDYATADGTATAGSDYVATSGTLSFAAGQATATVQVQVIGDTLVEANETFALNLSNATGATIADGQGIGTIVTDDVPPSVVIADAAITEGDAGQKMLTFTVTRSGGSEAFSVDYATADGTATAGSDYIATSGTLSFAAGETVKTISVVINGDTLLEPSETFQLNLTNATGGAVLADASATGTIVNDERVAIHDIQGSAYYSPILANEGLSAFNVASTTRVTVQAVVTALDDTGGRQGFYITEEKADWDNNDGTSEGIFVMTRNDANVGQALSSVIAGLKVGDLVTLSAQVMEYQFGQNLSRTVLVNAADITIGGSGYDLPTMVLDASRPIPNAVLTGVTPDYTLSVDGANDSFDLDTYAMSYFESVEGMLVTIPDMVAADGFVSLSGGQPYFKAYSTVHADADQINSRGGYTVAGDGPNSPPNTATTLDDTKSGGKYIHDGDVNPDIIEIDFTDFAIDAPAGLTTSLSMGDKLGSVTGILDFDFTDVKLFVQNIDTGAITNVQPEREVTNLGNDARSLTIATFNVENLDPTDVTAQQTAAKQGKFYDLARAIVSNLKSPDILSIEEIQDSNGAATGGVTINGVTYGATDATLTWEMLVSALNDISGQKYQWVDELPVYNAEGGEQSGNIRVGFLYNTNRVQLGDLPADATIEQRRQFTDRVGDGVRDAGDRIAFSDDMVAIDTAAWAGTRKSLLGEFTSNGNTVYAMANHLPSKGGSGTFWQNNQNLDAGQPANAGWEQRAAIGEDIYDVLNLIQKGDPGAGIVSGGDYNEYYFYRALEAATGYTYANGSVRNDGAKFDNLTVTELTEAERYTYTFEGRSQAIDHVIANQLMSAIASYDVVHINTGYNERGTGADISPALSDHDPALASFDFRSLGERLSGTAAGDVIEGFGGNDRIFGLAGNDQLFGGTGDDVLTGGEGNDLLDGGAGSDTADYADAAAGVAVNLKSVYAQNTGGAGIDRFVSIENVTGSRFADALTGDAGANVLTGLAGDDTLRGEGGDDLLLGGEGADFLDGGAGADLVLGGSGDDRLLGGDGDDVLIGGAGADRMTGGAGADLFVFAPGDLTTTPDVIGDFSRAEGDHIDLSAFGGLSFIGSSAFSLRAGEVRAVTGINSTNIDIDVDGDGVADAAIRLSGGIRLLADDFVL